MCCCDKINEFDLSFFLFLSLSLVGVPLYLLLFFFCILIIMIRPSMLWFCECVQFGWSPPISQTEWKYDIIHVFLSANEFDFSNAMLSISCACAFVCAERFFRSDWLIQRIRLLRSDCARIRIPKCEMRIARIEHFSHGCKKGRNWVERCDLTHTICHAQVAFSCWAAISSNIRSCYLFRFAKRTPCVSFTASILPSIDNIYSKICFSYWNQYQYHK